MTMLELVIVGWGLLLLTTAVVRLTEHSKLILDEVIFDPDPSKSKIGLTFASGTARFITGENRCQLIKKILKINTPTSQIGIRGTDFTVTVDELGSVACVILLPDQYGVSSGEITVEDCGQELYYSINPTKAPPHPSGKNSPTKPITLDITLDLIDNMLIVTPPEEQEIVEDTSNVKKADLLDFNDLDVDLLAEETLEEEDLEFTELDINFLDVNFFEDLLEVLEENRWTKRRQRKEEETKVL